MPYMRNSDDESSSLEPIAIVGMACRLPGSVDSASSLWDLLVKKGSAQTPKVPANRFNIDAHFHENLERPGSFNVLGGYFLDGALEDFDPTFFNITPIEAMWMDPQQRKMLEVSYECLESAGLALDAVSGSNTAVFVGSFTSDYQQMSVRDTDFRHNYAATGVDPGIISNRIGNTFNLRGPSFTINTACSSSVYAIHNACHALHAGDCEAAIAGGVNLILTVDQHMNTAKLGILSPTSTCHTFDVSADGYGRAEGAGALYLKRLSDAIRDGDPIRGVLRSSAVNTNGKVEGMGITHPSVKGQERVVRAAYQRANLDPNKTAYLECHGTGTPVGDPIETQAVSNAMNDTRSAEKPLLVGAIKANIGHSEAASGIFAVMKAAMMTEKAVIPGVAGFNKLNPAINEKGWNVKVNVDTVPWPADFPLRRASISSFGYGGTNGHVIVEAVESLYPWYEHGKPKAGADYDNSSSRPFLIGLSAHDKTTLTRNIAAHAKVADRFYLADLAYTLNTKRTRFAQRAFTIARDGKETEDFGSFKFGSATKASASKLGFIFTGQGAQWAGMAVEATQAFPSFLDTIRMLDSVLQKLEPSPSWSIEEVLLTPSKTSRISEAEIAQPVCTAIQIAIVDLFAQWDISPAVNVGHSSGEIAAAYAAGLLSAPEAIIAAFYRGLTVMQVAPSGSMLAAGVGVNEVGKYISDLSDTVVVACENSPSSVTLSGEFAGIQDAKRRLDGAKIFARELKTGKAYHSPQMSPVASVYNDLLSKAFPSLTQESLAWRQPRARMISSVTGDEFLDDHISVMYWSENLRNRVLFDSAITTLGQTKDLEDVDLVIEIGPHSALAGPFKQICLAKDFDRFTYIPTFVRNADSSVQLLKAAGELFLRDYPLNIQELNTIENASADTNIEKSRGPRLLTELPPYQWNYEKRFWTEPRFSHEQRNPRHGRHDLLGSRIAGLSDRSIVWRNMLRHRDLPWLKDHQLGNVAVFPAAGHMSLAVEALKQVSEIEGLHVESVTLRDVDIQTALVVPETDNGIEVQLRFQKIPNSTKPATWYSFTVESFADELWTSHSKGRIAINHEASTKKLDSPVDVSRLTQRVPGKRWYDAFNRVGFEYGPSFQPLSQIRTNGKDHDAAANLKIAVESGLMKGESRYILHPSTIDACLQLIIVSINAGRHKEMAWGVVPLKMEEVNLWFPGKHAGQGGHAVAWTDDRDGRYFNTHTKLATDAGDLVLEIKNLRCVAYEAAVPQNATEPRRREPYMAVSWKSDITSLSSAQAIRAYPEIQTETDSIGKIADLLNHKRPLRNVLTLGEPSLELVQVLRQSLPATVSIVLGDTSAELLERLQLLSEDNRVSTMVLAGDISQWKEVVAEPHDLIIIGRSIARNHTRVDVLRTAKSFLADNGHLISTVAGESGDAFVKQLHLAGYSSPKLRFDHAETSVILFDTVAYQNGVVHSQTKVTIISLAQTGQSLQDLAEQIRGRDCIAEVVDFTGICLPEAKQIIIYDAEGTLLSTLSAEAFETLKKVLGSGLPIVWLTVGTNEGKSVAGGMSQGFLRAIRSEQAAARITLLDVDTTEDMSFICEVLLKKLKTVTTKSSGADTEFWIHKGTVLIGRITPNKALNDQYSGANLSAQESKLPAAIAMEGEIINGELQFRPSSEERQNLSDAEVEIQVKFSDFQKTDLQPNNERPRIAVGTVLRVGKVVDSALEGQSVIAFTKKVFSTLVRVPETLCVSFASFEAAGLAAILPNLCQAVNATIKAGSVQSGEHVLVLPTSLPVVGAIVGLSHCLGFRVSVIVEAEDDRKECLSKYQLSSGDVHLTEDTEAIRKLLSESSENGPSVVIASNFSSLSQEVWRIIPAAGRFVLNESDLDEIPDSLPFTRGASFISTGIGTLYKRSASMIGDIIKLALDILKKHGDRFVQKPAIYDISALKVMRETMESSKDVNNTVIAYNYGESSVKIKPVGLKLRFSPDAVYLLVGCLGGLGRSLTTWMMERGCMNFAFISRSGTDKSEAAQVVDSIRKAGVGVQVFRADVTNEAHVAQVVSTISATRPIRGVVHAAMVLQDSMFEGMAYEKFVAAVNPKMKGALSLHKALRDTLLDFFVMTSSISAVLGNPGQSNYCAGNSFLDALAWHRNLNGLAASSLALPMVLDVGVVAENESIETSLTRKGMYGIDEREMLRGFETAMMQPVPCPPTSVSIGDAQIVLGLESAYLAAALSSDDTVDAYWYSDARLSGIKAVVEDVQNSSMSRNGSGGDFLGTLKSTVAQGPEAVTQVIAHHIMKRCSSILMTPEDSFDLEGKSVAAYGLDSMIGAELRNWLFKEFGLDIGFQMLLAPTLTFKALSVTVGETLGVLKSEETEG